MKATKNLPTGVELELRVESVPDDFCVEDLNVLVRDHEPDAIQITRARQNRRSGELQVYAESGFAPGAFMTVSIENFVFEAPMLYNASEGRYEYVVTTTENLRGRRITISTDEGGACNDFIRWPFCTLKFAGTDHCPNVSGDWPAMLGQCCRRHSTFTTRRGKAAPARPKLETLTVLSGLIVEVAVDNASRL